MSSFLSYFAKKSMKPSHQTKSVSSDSLISLTNREDHSTAARHHIHFTNISNPCRIIERLRFSSYKVYEKFLWKTTCRNRTHLSMDFFSSYMSVAFESKYHFFKFINACVASEKCRVGCYDKVACCMYFRGR